MLLESLFQEKYGMLILRHVYFAKEGCGISEISKSLNISKSAVFKTLLRLEGKNIVVSYPKGKWKLFKINMGNFFVNRVIDGLFCLESEIIDGLKKEIAGKFASEKFLSVILYGSFGTPKFNFSSDIDLMVITDKKQAETQKAIEKITKHFFEKGVILFVDALSREELERMYRTKEPLIKKVVETGTILSGKHPLELMR